MIEQECRPWTARKSIGDCWMASTYILRLAGLVRDDPETASFFFGLQFCYAGAERTNTLTLLAVRQAVSRIISTCFYLSPLT
jgi:hypothetical protein